MSLCAVSDDPEAALDDDDDTGSRIEETTWSQVRQDTLKVRLAS